ncbi:MAG: hypothetical protein HRT87_10975 [Legionellales bacterium]|nr:hypothetical protein [Legionellales bacterium]
MAKFFNSLIDKLQSVADLKLNEVAFKIASEKEVKDLVIRLNTQGEKTSQLFELGEDSLGDSLGSYSPFTVEQKKKRGQPTNRITLKDTGEFYSSFNVVPYRGGFTIKANPIKEESNLYDDFGADIVGLNETNLQILRDVYKDKVLEEVRKRIGNRLL